MRRIGAVGEGFGDAGQAVAAGQLDQRRAGQGDQHQARIDGADRLDHCQGLTSVVGNGVVQRAVGFHVAHRSAGGSGQGLQGADLVDHVGAQLIAGDIHIAAAEADQIRVGDMGADGHALGRSRLEGAQDAGRVTGVEATGDIGAGDDVEHRGIVAHGPLAETLAQVAVEVDGWHVGSPRG
ncbi:hypothetical protein SRABI70_02327 [Pseudomonas sp. Bi70]|nr:hypothetical protein SRABI70_02327 [Pseudomonas sp. Bi70]